MTDCKHLMLKKQDPESPAQRLHKGPEKAFNCEDCGMLVFVLLEPATIKVTYRRPKP